MSQRDGDMLRCSFCGKSQHEVRKLIAGPTVYICNECVEVCLDIISEDRKEEARARRPVIPKPDEIKAQLTALRQPLASVSARLATLPSKTSQSIASPMRSEA